jgi:DNA-binding HxlR family transcriptional regulator
MGGRARFATLRAAIPDISDRMLSERLQILEAEEIIVRYVLPDPPVRVEYELTRKGRDLQVPLDSIARWAERWLPDEPAAVVAPEPPARASRRDPDARRAATVQRMARARRAARP